MKFLRILSVALIALFPAVCPAQEPQYLDEPEQIEVSGPYVHEASGMRFPIAVGDWERGSVYRYDVDALDVSAGYRIELPGGAIVATVYVYPAPAVPSTGTAPEILAAAQAKSCKGEFERRKREVLDYYDGARLAEEAEAAAPHAGAPGSGWHGVFAYEDVLGERRQPLHSELFVFCHVGGPWAFEYRLTHPEAVDGVKPIAAFMLGLPWTVSASP